MDFKQREAVALFRMSVIGDLLVAGLSPEQRRRLLKDKANRVYSIPGSRRTRIAVTTLRDWLRLYEQGGLEALKPTFRCDKAHSRSIPPEIADRIVGLKEEDPSRSVHTILAMLRHANILPPTLCLPPSTVYRLLSGRGFSKHASPRRVKKDLRAFAYEKPNQLWQSDVMHGPPILDPKTGKKRKTYLIALLDDATRVVSHAAFCFSEKLIDFLPVFRLALLKRGLPDRVFVDNGAAFVSTHLSIICASLRVALIHARPYSPESKGKIERFFRTLRGQFLSQIDLDLIGNLDDLNARLWAWIEGEYHRNPHRGLGGQESSQTPIDRWMLHVDSLRQAPRDIDEHFLVRAERLVYQDRTVRLNAQIFEAPAEYVGLRIELRYDPGRLPLREVFLYDKGHCVETLKPLDLHANTRVRRQIIDPTEKTETPKKTSGLNYVELLHQKHQSLIQPPSEPQNPNQEGQNP
jgi:transposase InsO family protein